MLQYLLDTNVCIDFARGRSMALLERMEASPERSLAMSAITFAELSVGAKADSGGDREKLEALAAIVQVMPLDRSAAAEYGSLVRAGGLRRNSFDRLIAAHALALGLKLVTNNEVDFADVPGLVVENWTRAA